MQNVAVRGFRSFRLALLFLGGTAFVTAQLPPPEAPFTGRVDVNRDKSVPAWPHGPVAPAGAPNVVLILLDDIGFGATSAFGGPVSTPAFDALAKSGLKYNRFHVNSLCSPTRAALLSGRNDHEIGFGTVIEAAQGYPGYNSIWPKSAASIAEILKQNGYSTAAFGKWHNTPAWETNAAGPFDHWPTGLGFEYFYGFVAGMDNQWFPRLYRNTTPVEPSATPAEGYHLTTDLANDATNWVRQHDAIAPQKPFFLYFATGAAHEPHHVSQAWIDKYKGKFDQGWDALREQTFANQKEFGIIPPKAELTPRPKELPAWNSLDAGQKKLLAHQMEIYAAFIAQTDYEIGRLLDNIRAEGHVEDTIVFYIPGDNGATAEGGLNGHDVLTAAGAPESIAHRLEHMSDLGSELYLNQYAAGWAYATNTPFQWGKQVASHLGGTRDPLVVSWPGHIKDIGTMRPQFHHVTDIAPTIYELAHIHFPDTVNGVKQLPLEGKSMVYSFDHPEQPSPHTIQYFEMVGNRGIYKDGWWAGSRNSLPWEVGLHWEDHSPEDNPWELYNLNEDYSQAHNIASQNPEKLKELQELFDSEARRNNVYPLTAHRGPMPTPYGDAKSFVYHSRITRIPNASAPRLNGHAFHITADIEVPESGANGVIIAQGGMWGGYTMFVKDNHIVYEVNSSGNMAGSLISSESLRPGKAHIVLSFNPDSANESPGLLGGLSPSPGSARLMLNGKLAGETKITRLGVYYFETLDVGSDLGSPVSHAYTTPFTFTGTIDTVRVDID